MKDTEQKTQQMSMVGQAMQQPAVMVNGFGKLFGASRFRVHRLMGLTFLIQFAAEVYLYLFDYPAYLASPLVWSVPLNGFLQSVNAALTFTFLPRKEDPGFAAVSDKSGLSYYTVVENSFYAMQLLFACCYLHNDIRPLIQKCVVVEPFFVFFVFYARNLWPSSRISAALKNPSNKSAANMRKLTISAYAIKVFYVFAKHFVGFFPLYLRFLDRVDADDQRLLYGVQVLSAYASTISIFIHTLKFKHYIGPVTAMVAYDIIIPGYAYLFFNMSHLILNNSDVALIALVGMFLNIAPKPTWHIYQALVAFVFYAGFLRTGTI